MTKQLTFGQKVVVAVVTVTIIALVASASVNAYLQRRAINESVQAHLADTGQVAAATIAYWLDARIKLIESEAQALGHDVSPVQVVDILEQESYTRHFRSTYVGAADGRFIDRPTQAIPVGYDPRQRPWYSAAISAGGTVLTSPYTFAASDELGITIATPLVRNGERVGVVGGDLSLAALVRIITSLTAGGLGEAFLVDANGSIIVSRHADQVQKTIKDLFPVQTPTLTPGFQEVMQEGTERLVSFTPIEGLPSVKWYLALSIDRAKTYAPATRMQNLSIVVTLVALLVIILLLSALIRVLVRPLHELTHAMDGIAQGEGDLRCRLPVRSADEFGALAKAFNRFVTRIHDSIRDVAQSADELNQGTRRVTKASQSSMHQSALQSQRTSSVAAAVNELGASSQEIACSAAQAFRQAGMALDQGSEGRTVLGQALQAMQTLSDEIGTGCKHIEALDGRASNISQVLNVIRGISEQTNLLALNAAIEAARAGEAGRGFAVVADEVRSLASGTQHSARQIQQMIEELQDGSRSAVALMQESQRQSVISMEVARSAGERLDGVTQRINEINGQNQSVAMATEEQTSVTEALNRDISEIDLLNQHSVDNLDATLAACADLEVQADRLQRLVGGFKI